jgi:hypothetical protein
MNAVLTARQIAAGRIGFGVGLVLAPQRLTAGWLGQDSGRTGTQVVTRGLGARDMALGAGALTVPESQLGPWVAAGIIADAADLLATVTAPDLPPAGRVLVAAIASAGVALGAMALAGLRSDSSSR